MSFLFSKVKLPYRKGKHAEKENPMLFPHNRNFLYAADENKGNPAPDTSQETIEDKGKTYTEAELQAELNRVAAKEKREGKQSAEKAMLEALGVTNLDEIKAILEAKRKADESAKSETEKLTEALAAKDKELLEAKQKAELAEKRRIEAIRDSAIRNALNDAHDSDSTLLVFQSKNAKAIDGLIDESGVVDTTELAKLVAEFRAKNAYLFKGNSKGSPSNDGGRLLKPDAEVQKQARDEIKRKFNF